MHLHSFCVNNSNDFPCSGPEYLNIEGVNENVEGNWALKSSNIRTLMRCIELFYREELGQICDTAEILDIQLISKENNPQEIAKLVELILGCAVQCANKEIYIHPIMQKVEIIIIVRLRSLLKKQMVMMKSIEKS